MNASLLLAEAHWVSLGCCYLAAAPPSTLRAWPVVNPAPELLNNFVFSTDAGAGKIVKSLFELGVSEGGLFSAQ
jgi:hypothetical protein